jgi:hypothetical protein
MFVLKIDTSNDAFVEDARGEIARILEEVTSAIYNAKEPSKLYDVNGNVCGNIEWNI